MKKDSKKDRKREKQVDSQGNKNEVLNPERDPNAFRHQADFDDGVFVGSPSDGVFGCEGENHSYAVWEFEDESEPFRWRIRQDSFGQGENGLVWGKDFLSPEWFERWESTLKSEMLQLRDIIREKMEREIKNRKQEDIYQESLLSDVAETCGALLRMKEMLEKVEPRDKDAFRSLVRLALEAGFSHALSIIRKRSKHLEIRHKSYKGLRESSSEGGKSTQEKKSKRPKIQKLLKGELSKEKIDLAVLPKIPREIRLRVERKGYKYRTVLRASKDLLEDLREKD